MLMGRHVLHSDVIFSGFLRAASVATSGNFGAVRKRPLRLAVPGALDAKQRHLLRLQFNRKKWIAPPFRPLPLSSGIAVFTPLASIGT
jgi:hypothetical protein